MTERWGILGGVFDPVHFGHLVIAEQVASGLELDRVLFVPANVPVHKVAASATAQDRVRMVEIATADNERFSVSTIELDSGVSGYTVDTVELLTRDSPGREWVLILSAESASHLPEWHDPQRLLDLVEVAVVPRLGYANIPREWLEAYFPAHVERFLFVATSVLGNSSSDIRARRAAGRSIRYLVPPAVERYIGEHGLYGADVRPEA